MIEELRLTKRSNSAIEETLIYYAFPGASGVNPCSRSGRSSCYNKIGLGCSRSCEAD